MPRKAFEPSSRQILVMSQMWKQGVSVPAIAAEFGTTSFTVNGLCRKHRDLFPIRRAVDGMAVKIRACERCGASFSSRWARGKYCTSCKGAVYADDAKRSIKSRADTKSDAIAEIHQTLGRQVTSLAGMFGEPILAWCVTFSIPYDANLSKNARWRAGANGVVYTTERVRKLDAEIQRAVVDALDGREVVQNKVWVSFFVEKPDHKSDAINVVDTLCDAIKKAVGVDDRWFSIRQLDWAIKKTDPHIIISIAQESNENVISCSHCGEMKSPEAFNRNKSGPFGRARACISCKRVLDRAASKNRKQVAA